MNISVSGMPVRLSVSEGLRVEFKSSMFFGPAKQRQVEVVAQTVAAFMNTAGGDLYVGVSDDGTVVGIQGDLNALVQNNPMACVDGPYLDDAKSGYVYSKANIDQLGLKFNAIVQSYLGKAALRYVCDLEAVEVAVGRTYVRFPVLPADKGDVVLFQPRPGAPTELWTRVTNQKKILKDRDRDDFVARKALERKRVDGADEIFAEIRQLTELVKRQSSVEHPPRVVSPELTPPLRAAPEQPVADTETKPLPVEEIVNRINAFFAARDRKTVQRTLSHGYDATTSSTFVMDQFEERDGECPKYDKLLLHSFGRGPSFIPYVEVENPIDEKHAYRRVCDFCVAEVDLVVERSCVNRPTGAFAAFSFSDLKKGYTGGLADAIWKSVSKGSYNLRQVESAPVSRYELRLLESVTFKAHTSESFGERLISDPNRYAVVAIRFKKEPLFYLPEYLSFAECREYRGRNQEECLRLALQGTSFHTENGGSV